MKAFLLAAGYGTRLKPLTDTLPKCLIPINGQPLLDIWLNLLENEGVTDVLINTHYLADKVKDFVKARKNKIEIVLSYEESLLGSGGTILKNKEFVKENENFFILYADNLTNVSLIDLVDFHRSKDSIFTTYVYETEVPKQKGIFTANLNSGKVLNFEEKPAEPKSNIANAGIGILNYRIFNYLDGNNEVIDFGKDIMPKIIDNMYVRLTDEFIKDIGTFKDYLSAQEEWKTLK